MKTESMNSLELIPKTSPAGLALYTSGGNWKLARHLALLNRLCLKLASRKIKRLLVSCPPRHGKSSFVSQYLTAWWLGMFPDEKVILTSYGADLAYYWSGKARGVLEEFGQSVFGVTPAGPVGRWDIVGRRGNFQAAGVGGPVTGFGADLFIADDLLKNAEEAQSETVRNSTWDWWTSTASTRLEPNAVIVMIATRWHLDDPIGRILRSMKEDEKSEKWEVYDLAAIAEENEPAWPDGIGRKKGDALWPERYDVPVLEGIRRQLGEYWWRSLYMQRPVPLSGGMFKETFFNQRCKAAPYQAKRIRYWDRASSEGKGCNTAGVLMAKSENPTNFYVEDVVKGQWEPDERNQKMLATALKDRMRYGPNNEPEIWVEAEGGSSGRDAWKAVARALAGFVVREDRVTGKKEVRAEPWACQLASKNVYLVDDGSWDINGYVSEHCSFPFGEKLDMVDSSSGAFNLLIGKKASGTLQIHKFSDRLKKSPFRVIVCSEIELANLIVEEPSILISISDEEKQLPLHGLNKLQGSLQLNFCDLSPEELQDKWNDSVLSNGKNPLEEKIMRTEHGKKFWAFMHKKQRDLPPPEVYVFQDNGDRRARSMIFGFLEMVGQPRTIIFDVGKPDETKHEGSPPNNHVYSVVKACRSMVL